MRSVHIFFLFIPKIKRHLEIKFYNGNQVEDKMTWGLGYYVFIQVLAAHIPPNSLVFF